MGALLADFAATGGKQADPSQGGVGVPAEIVIAVGAACLLLALTVLALGKLQRRRDPLEVNERETRVEMNRLCPDGWSTRITIYGDRSPLPDDAPPAEEGRRVCVEWTEYAATETGGRRVAVARRMWARTIPGALRGVIADRRLDAQLEEIERTATVEDLADRT
jgi:hypothetical protein